MNQVDRSYGVVQALVMPEHARIVADVVVKLADIGFTVRAFGANPARIFVHVEYSALCEAAHSRGEAAWYRIERTPNGSLYTYRWFFGGAEVEWQQLNPELH